MRYHALVFLAVLGLFFFCSSSQAKTLLTSWQVCDGDDCRDTDVGQDLYKVAGFSVSQNRLIYKKHFSTPKECLHGDCWLFLGEVADSGQVVLNGHILAHFSSMAGPNYYIRHKSMIVPMSIDLFEQDNLLEVHIEDYNQTLFGLRSSEVFFSNYQEAFDAARADEFRRTDITLLSSFALALLFFGLLLTFIQVRSVEVFSLAFYAGITSVYLFSFSEVPREFIDPLFASAPLHFSLRLLQDFGVFVLVATFLTTGKKPLWIKVMYGVYIAIISSFWVLWTSGVHAYAFYIKYLHFCMLFQTFPLFCGFYLALKLSEPTERRILGLVFAVLSVLQVYDHLVFYQVVRGFFFVRFYPPLLIIALAFIYIRRKALETSQLATEAALGGMMKQVSHDIRSPLSALQMVALHSKDVPENMRLLLKTSVSRIQDIAEELLGKSRKTEDGLQSNSLSDEPQLLAPLIDTIASEKRVQYSRHVDVSLEFVPSSEAVTSSSKVDPALFKRVLSNLVNNAFESLGKDGEIRLSLSHEQGFNVVSVRDNGQGMSKEVLNQVGQKGFSHGKSRGTGLGLHHAKEIVEQWGGSLKIESTPGQGTVVSLLLKQAQAPKWFMPELNVRDVERFVVLDDDASIHQIWEQRLEPQLKRKKILHFFSASDFTAWYRSEASPEEQTVFLCDYELRNDDVTGLDTIEKLAIKNAVLVTSQYEDQNVLKRCGRLGLKLVPKNVVGFLNVLDA